MQDQLDDIIRSVVADIAAAAPHADRVPGTAPQRMQRDVQAMARPVPPRVRWLPAVAVLGALVVLVVAVGLVNLRGTNHMTSVSPMSSRPAVSDAAPTSSGESPTTSAPTLDGGSTPGYPSVDALVTAHPNSTTITLDIGSDYGIQLGMPVIDEDGVVGKVIAVTSTTSTVRLVTDPLYAIECSVAGSDGVTIGCQGAGAGQPLRLATVTATSLPTAGTAVTTAGGPTSLAPPGLVVGVRVNDKVVPAAHLDTLSAVSVVLYRPAQLTDEGSPAGLGIVGSLPDGLQIWDVSRSMYAVSQPRTLQAFAERTPSGDRVERGLLVTVTPVVGSAGSSSGDGTIIRGNPAVTSADVAAGNPIWSWSEGDYRVSAEAHGLDTPGALAAIEALRWRDDRQEGFDPSSTTLPLLDEHIEHAEDTGTFTRYVLARSAAEIAGTSDTARQIDISIGLGTVFSSPMVRFRGVLQPSGVVVCEYCQANTYDLALMPTGEVVSFGSLDHGVVTALLAALGPVTTALLDEQAIDSTDRVGAMDVLASATVGDAIIEERGTDPISSSAECIVVADRRSCQVYQADTNAAVPSTTLTSVLLDGQWYIAQVGPRGTTQSTFSADGQQLTPIRSDAESRTWWLWSIPDGVDAVHIDVGDGPSQPLPPSRELHRPMIGGSSGTAPIVLAPTDGAATPGVTTTTTSNPYGAPYAFTPLVLDEAPAGYTLQSAEYVPDGRRYFGLVTYGPGTGATTLQLIVRPYDDWLETPWLKDRQRWIIDGRTVVDDGQTPGCNYDFCSVSVQWDATTNVSITWSTTDGTVEPQHHLDELVDLVAHLVVDPTPYHQGTPPGN